MGVDTRILNLSCLGAQASDIGCGKSPFQQFFEHTPCKLARMLEFVNKGLNYLSHTVSFIIHSERGIDHVEKICSN